MISRQPVQRRPDPGRRRSRVPSPMRRERVGNVRHRQHEIDGAGHDRAARHAVIAGFVGILRDDQAALFLDRLQTEAAVGAGAREDHADRALPQFLGQGPQQKIERQTRAVTRLRLREAQVALADGQIGPGRNDIQVVALDRHPVGGLPHRHRRCGAPADPTIMLSCVGSRCCTRMNAMPVSAAEPPEACVQASRPPAEAPMPTTGKSADATGGSRAGMARALGRGRAVFAMAQTIFWHLPMVLDWAPPRTGALSLYGHEFPAVTMPGSDSVAVYLRRLSIDIDLSSF